MLPAVRRARDGSGDERRGQSGGEQDASCWAVAHGVRAQRPAARGNRASLSVGPNRRIGIPRASVWQSLGVSTQEERATRFQALHAGAPFVIPNPWDAGSARVLEALGFNALATTSSGFAFTLGRLDGNVTLDEVVQHVRLLAGAVDLPISVDLENGFGSEPEHAAEAVARVAEAGAVGGSIEDWDPAGHLYELPHAVERVAAAVEAARGFGWPFTLTARAENHIRGNPDLDDTIARLQAFERAGADVLYAPGLESAPEIRAVCEAVSKPVNVLARRGLSTADIVEAGAQRISVGGALTWTAVECVRRGGDGDRASEATTRRWATAHDSPTGSSRSRSAAASSDPAASFHVKWPAPSITSSRATPAGSASRISW